MDTLRVLQYVEVPCEEDNGRESLKLYAKTRPPDLTASGYELSHSYYENAPDTNHENARGVLVFEYELIHCYKRIPQRPGIEA